MGVGICTEFAACSTSFVGERSTPLVSIEHSPNGLIPLTRGQKCRSRDPEDLNRYWPLLLTSRSQG